MQATHHRRRITFGTLALTLAFLLGSMVPSNANAEDNGGGRQGAVDQANDYVEACVGNGGEPSIDAPDGFSWIEVSCNLGDVTDYCYYYFDGTRSCGQYENPLSPTNPGTRPPFVTGGDSAAQPSATDPEASETEEDNPVADAPDTADSQESVSPSGPGQDDERETNKGKKSKKGKGKKGGKHRKR